MARTAYLSRQVLFVNDNVFVGSGTDFGTKGISAYTRISGLASVVGSATIRLRTSLGNPAGPFIVSSNWNVNSGPTVMDAPVFGSILSVDVTAVTSQAAYSFAIYGDPVR